MQTGQIMSRVVNDTNNFEALMAHAVPEMTVSLLTLFGVSGMLFYINRTLAVYTLFPIPFILIGFYLYNRHVRPLFRASQVKLGELNATLQDNLSGMREIQVFTQEERESGRIGDKVQKHAWAITKAVSTSSCFSGAIDFLAGLGTVSVVFFGGQMALRGQMSIADVTGFLLYVSSFYEPIGHLNRTNEALQQALAAADRYFDVLDTIPEIKDDPQARPMPKTKGHIVYEDVSFRYGQDVPVLEHINLDIQPGEMVALVGQRESARPQWPTSYRAFTIPLKAGSFWMGLTLERSGCLRSGGISVWSCRTCSSSTGLWRTTYPTGVRLRPART